jgi:cytochrome c biogenesis protein CcmG/thiol:disulfide interchange protein DsbE
MNVRATRSSLAAAAVMAGGLALVACADAGNPEIGATLTARSTPGPTGSPVDGSFEMMTGGRRSLADYRGRPLVVNFFASWCVPCLAEMPGFERVHRELADQVAFLGLNLQDPVDAGRSVVERTGVTYDIGRDPDGALFQSFGGIAMPTTVFIDASGAVVDLHSGEITAGELRDRIDELLLG